MRRIIKLSLLAGILLLLLAGCGGGGGGQQEIGFITNIAIQPTNSSFVFITRQYEVLGAAKLYKSTNAGASWSIVRDLQAYNVTCVFFDPLTPASVYVGTQSNGIFLSIDNGTTWVNQYPNAVPIVKAFPDPSGKVFTATQYGVSSLSGGDWASVYDEGALAVASSASDPSLIYLYESGTFGRLLKSTDAGENWTVVNTRMRETESLAVDPNDSSTLYAAYPDGLARSTDGGVTWKKVNTYWCQEVKFDPADPDIIYTCHNNIYKSTDGGANWENISGNTWFWTLAFDPANTSNILAGSWNGIYKSVDGGANWTPCNSGL